MTMMVRGECARGLPELIEQLGGDPVRLLDEHGLSPGVIAQPHAFISHRALIHALEHAARALDSPDFGVRLAAEQDVSVLGPLAVAVSNAPTLGEALRCCSKYLYTHAPAVNFTLRPIEGAPRVTLAVEFLLERLPPHRQAAEAHVGLLFRVISMLTEGRCRPFAVTFRHGAASPAAAQSCFHFFGAPVRYEAADDGLIISAADLDIPIEGRDQQLQEIAASFLELNFPAPAGRLAAQVRVLAERLLNAGCCTQQEAAAALGMQARTLQRRLQEEGASFEILRDHARRDLAERYLAQRAIPLSQISAMLGYAEPSAFTRSCRRWFDRSPREMRAQPLSTAAAMHASPAPT